MEQLTLRAEARSQRGSRASRRLRRDGLVPAVVYGRDLEPVTVTVDARELSGALRTEAGLNALIDLQFDGQGVLTVARELQRHPVRGDITHLDFIKVSLDEEITAEVGIEFEGTPAGVSEGGVMEVIQASIDIEALPTSIPSSIAIDVTQLEIGDVLTVGDLPEIDGVRYLVDEDQPIVTVSVPAALEVEEPEVEGLEELEGLEEGAEAEEAEADDGSADATDAEG